MTTKPTERFTYSRNGTGKADEQCAIRVNITGVTTDAQHTRYMVSVMNAQTRQSWQTSHRYSEFLSLRNELIAHFGKAERKCPGCVNFEKVIQLFEFPTKRLFTSKNAVVINYRKTALRAFLALLASHTFTNSPKCPTCSGLPFTAVRDFLTEQAGGASDTNSADGSIGDRESIRESIQVKNFTTYVPPAAHKPVNSEGVFIQNKRNERKAKGKPAGPRNDAAAATRASAPPQKKAATPKAAADLPSPVSSTSGSLSSATSAPPSPAAAPRREPSADNGESFVSFSGPSVSAAPKQENAQSAPSEAHQKSKRGSSHPSLQSQPSVKESQDDEFGSLNLDFLQNVSIAKD